MVGDAVRLMAEADMVLGRPDRGADFWKACTQKAVEISDYLGQNGDSLDRMGLGWMVDALGAKVDALAAGARGSLGAAQKSPWAAAADSLQKDAETALKFGLPAAAVALVIVALILLRR